jgi:hypothetical protein
LTLCIDLEDFNGGTNVLKEEMKVLVDVFCLWTDQQHIERICERHTQDRVLLPF